MQKYIRCLKKEALFFCLALIFFALPRINYAHAIQLNSRTYLKLAETFEDKKTAPVFEYLDLYSPVSFKDYQLDINLGLWLKADITGNDPERNTDQDLQYGYLTVRDKKGLYTFKAGRILLLEGITNERIDGIYGSLKPSKNIRAAVYLGSPASLDVDGRDGDFAYGAAVWYFHKIFTASVSYINEKNDSSTFKDTIAVDITANPVEKLLLYGRSIYNLDSSGFGANELALNYGPLKDRVSVSLQLSNYDYRHFFSNSTNPAFAQRTGVIDKKESLTLLDAALDIVITEVVSVKGTFTHYSYEISDSANAFGIAVEYNPDAGDFMSRPSKALGGSILRVSGGTDELRYTQLRAYGYYTVRGYRIALDMLIDRYDEKRNGEDLGFESSVAAERHLKDNLNIGVDITYEQGPLYKSRLTGFLKLIYVFQG